jgi:hypothetical protein
MNKEQGTDEQGMDKQITDKRVTTTGEQREGSTGN